MELLLKILVLLGIIFIIFILYVSFENHNLKISQYSVKSERLPKEFHGTKFVLLADLHNNRFGKENEVLLSQIIKINPDFIVIAGDMIVGKTHNDYHIAYSFLSKLAAKYPIYYGLGNHEQRVMPGGKHYDEAFNGYKEDLEKAGVVFLNNGSATITKNNQKIVITGILLGTTFFRKFKKMKMDTDYLQNLVGIPNNQCYNILIAHNPVYFKNYIDWGADLIVSGHLHGGIVRLPKVGGVISPQYEIFPFFDAGYFEEKGKVMLVSRGLGTHTIKIRVCNPPELMTVILEN
ncbi:MAG: metallophosphoesterase [Lachnospiraceae bacterium]|jgi:predicted MPP superfamily phosphohydrolase|nr:metallophosphoesterase [Lachnospiraceae bacterium]